MAQAYSMTVQPQLPPGSRDPSRALNVTRAVTAGRLHATWVLSSDRPQHQGEPGASQDRKISPYDFSPCYDDNGARFLLFTSRFETEVGVYLLMSISLQSGNAAVKPVYLFRWHLVEEEEELLKAAACGRMMRDDRKIARKTYYLATSASVSDSDIFPDSCFPKMSLMNGSKFILMVDWDRGIELVGEEDEL